VILAFQASAYRRQHGELFGVLTIAQTGNCHLISRVALGSSKVRTPSQLGHHSNPVILSSCLRLLTH
jgi:hypothetical protein